MFCSSSISVHLLRGLGAAVLLGLAVFLGTDGAVPVLARFTAVPLVIGAFLLLRGCPMCWLMGLFETIGKRRSRPDGP